MTALGACYKQLNSSVGEFGTDTLIASTRAIESNSPGDSAYLSTDQALRRLEVSRDRLAQQIKDGLEAAAFGNVPVHHVIDQLVDCRGLIHDAHRLAS